MSVPVDFPSPAPLRGLVPEQSIRAYPACGHAGPHAAKALLEQARQGLIQAEQEEQPSERYAAAHLSGLRGAAAVLALRGRPAKYGNRPTSAWVLLTSIAPELREWAAFFAAGSARRAAVQAGITRLVSTRDADDMVRQAAQFLDLVERIVHGAQP